MRLQSILSLVLSTVLVAVTLFLTVQFAAPFLTVDNLGRQTILGTGLLGVGYVAIGIWGLGVVLNWVIFIKGLFPKRRKIGYHAQNIPLSAVKKIADSK